MSAKRGRALATLAFAAPLSLVAFFYASHLRIELAPIEAICASVPLPLHAESLLSTDAVVSDWAASAGWVRFSVAVIDAEPENAAVGSLDAFAASLDGARALAAAASDCTDVMIQRPSFSAHATLAEPALIAPEKVAGAASDFLAFVAPAWSIPALRALNDASFFSSSKGAAPDLYYPAAFGDVHDYGWCSPFTVTTAVRRRSVTPPNASSACTCMPPLLEGQTIEGAIVDGVAAQLGGIMGSLAQSLQAVLSRAPPSSDKAAWTCEPSARVECGPSSGDGGRTRWCRVLHIVPADVAVALAVPPRALTPFYFESTDEDSLTSPPPLIQSLWPRRVAIHCTHGGTRCRTASDTIRIQGWGFVHLLNNAREDESPSAQRTDGDGAVGALASEGGLALDRDDTHERITSAMRETLGLPHDYEASGPLSSSVIARWQRVHESAVHRALARGPCAAPREGALTERVPRHAAAALAAVVAELLVAANATACGDSVGALLATRRARFHAEAAATDAFTTPDAPLAWMHYLAVYAPFWMVIATPLTIAIIGALRDCADGK